MKALWITAAVLAGATVAEAQTTTTNIIRSGNQTTYITNGARGQSTMTITRSGDSYHVHTTRPAPTPRPEWTSRTRGTYTGRNW